MERFASEQVGNEVHHPPKNLEIGENTLERNKGREGKVLRSSFAGIKALADKKARALAAAALVGLGGAGLANNVEAQTPVWNGQYQGQQGFVNPNGSQGGWGQGGRIVGTAENVARGIGASIINQVIAPTDVQVVGLQNGKPIFSFNPQVLMQKAPQGYEWGIQNEARELMSQMGLTPSRPGEVFSILNTRNPNDRIDGTTLQLGQGTRKVVVEVARDNIGLMLKVLSEVTDPTTGGRYRLAQEMPFTVGADGRIQTGSVSSQRLP